MTQRFAGFRLVFAVVALALWAGDAANAQVERTPTAENVVRNVKRTPSPDANPVVAPRRVSEAPVAASRGGARAARVGGTGGDSARSVGSGRLNDIQENTLPNNDCTDLGVINANELACCLKTCREELYVCVMGDHDSCSSASLESKTPIQCFKEFKCCLDACFPDCEPVCEPPCVPNNDVCIPETSVCCDVTYECCDVDLTCELIGDCTTCKDVGLACDLSAECCDSLECCGTGSGKTCSDNCGCIGCDQDKFCCIFDITCKEEGDCCAAETETCFARDDDLLEWDWDTNVVGPTSPGRCCFSEAKGNSGKNTDQTVGSEGDCGGTYTTFGRWGWTNGPYDLSSSSEGTTFTKDLTFWCGAGQCDISNGAFNAGEVRIKSTGSVITATWADAGARFWTMHLGCGSGDSSGSVENPNLNTGVYPLNIGSGMYTVAPGQYEFKSDDDTTATSITVNDSALAICTELWVIIHTCGVEQVP